MTRSSSRPPAAWYPTAATLAHARPDLAGVGCLDAATLAVSAA